MKTKQKKTFCTKAKVFKELKLTITHLNKHLTINLHIFHFCININQALDHSVCGLVNISLHNETFSLGIQEFLIQGFLFEATSCSFGHRQIYVL